MSFTSWLYPFLLGSTTLLYWLLPQRGRVLLLLGVSYVFYATWDPRFLALLIASTVVDFLGGLAIAGERRPWYEVIILPWIPALWLTLHQASFVWANSGKPTGVTSFATAIIFAILYPFFYNQIFQIAEKSRPRVFLIFGIILQLTLLGYFKYFNFFCESLSSGLQLFGTSLSWTMLRIILPVGISFYTFQSMAYAIDVYRGKITPCRNFTLFAAFVSFFPQLVAGPIERGAHLLPQIENTPSFKIDYLRRGMRYVLVGYFLKIYVADNCAILADYVFHVTKGATTAPWALLGVVAFTFQIYGDFAGYTSIARGSAAFLGIDLIQNFRFPYISRGPSDFWNRWHISLSTWFRDYVYIPLGGNRGTRAEVLRNLIMTMFLAGLWHGAGWMFVLWGLYHGLLLVVYRVTPPLRNLEDSTASLWWRRPVSALLMFILVVFGWAIFRCGEETPAAFISWLYSFGNFSGLSASKPFVWLLIHVVPLLLLQSLTTSECDEARIEYLPQWARCIIYIILFLLVASSAVTDQEFIYFQF